ncbi:SUZ RNA-binding domain-containing [Parasteatoda tepidariorum]|uniref:SUZ RNA-binding domain-containing n=1 Tax=Parasteatoda tepidariorum TaxID=114398 RepID=UPI00077F8E0B|nr:SUZ domain-containing protein 1 [Parasteatoda tepidariorum]
MAQDVADDVCDSWEDMIENGILDKKLEELHLKAPKINNSVLDSNTSEYSQMRLEEENSRTPYVPQVKILKRPTNDAKSSRVVVEKSPSRQPLKTLKQREAEYAEARLRILGSASSEEEPSNPNAVPASMDRRIEAEIIVTRLPRGPDGSKGFLQPR